MSEKTRFVKRFGSEKVFFDQELCRSKNCFGARAFENGHNAYVLKNNEIEVYSQARMLVDVFLDDVFYFATGESFKKQCGSDTWKFVKRNGSCIMHGQDVKVLNKNLAAIRSIDGFWHIYLLSNMVEPVMITVSPSPDAIDVEYVKISLNVFVFAFTNPDGSLKIIAKAYDKKGFVKDINAKRYVVINKNVLVVNTGKYDFLDAKKMNNCRYIYAGLDNNLSVYNCNMELIKDNVEDVISFNNGALALKVDDKWEFYSLNGDKWGELTQVDVLRDGIIMGKTHKRQEKMQQLGLCNDNYVFLLQGEQTVVSDGRKTVSMVNVHFDDVKIVE